MTHTLTTDEAIEILEDIARNAGNAAARIAAIKQLELMRDGNRPPAEGEADLYNVVELKQRSA